MTSNEGREDIALAVRSVSSLPGHFSMVHILQSRYGIFAVVLST